VVRAATPQPDRLGRAGVDERAVQGPRGRGAAAERVEHRVDAEKARPRFGSERRAVAAPAVLAGVVADARPDRIEDDVTASLEKVRVGLDEL